ncbi:hypothetical protein CLU79DRAFT_747747 [Phycomyces nitens]|nr:hypothetical protein CLU79DRAFT_747747 [Phycomyces nitens]
MLNIEINGNILTINNKAVVLKSGYATASYARSRPTKPMAAKNQVRLTRKQKKEKKNSVAQCTTTKEAKTRLQVEYEKALEILFQENQVNPKGPDESQPIDPLPTGKVSRVQPPKQLISVIHNHLKKNDTTQPSPGTTPAESANTEQLKTPEPTLSREYSLAGGVVKKRYFENYTRQRCEICEIRDAYDKHDRRGIRCKHKRPTTYRMCDTCNRYDMYKKYLAPERSEVNEKWAKCDIQESVKTTVLDNNKTEKCSCNNDSTDNEIHKNIRSNDWTSNRQPTMTHQIPVIIPIPVPLTQFASDGVPILPYFNRNICKYLSNCNEVGCKDLHPSRNPLHNLQPCVYGSKCNRVACPYFHEYSTTPIYEQKCKFDGTCVRPGCFYKHIRQTPPSEARNKTIVNNCKEKTMKESPVLENDATEKPNCEYPDAETVKNVTDEVDSASATPVKVADGKVADDKVADDKVADDKVDSEETALEATTKEATDDKPIKEKAVDEKPVIRKSALRKADSNKATPKNVTFVGIKRKNGGGGRGRLCKKRSKSATTNSFSALEMGAGEDPVV